MLVQPLDAAFYNQPTLELARGLLGKLLVKETAAGIASGWIVETEAYIGPGDRAAHGFRNRRTPRTEIMFGPPGYVYTYVMHTHCLINVTCGELDHPEAVLIRALQPCSGIELMYERRGLHLKEKELTNGPGKLTKALGIDKTDYGRSLSVPPLIIAEGNEIARGIDTAYRLDIAKIAVGPRIGIPNSGEAKDYPWRFWLAGNRYVSSPAK